jgi:hypothetical protein
LEQLGDEILEIGSSLGQARTGRGGRLIETLAVVSADQANANSLSARYGTGTFPLHTDGAHLPEPPHFLVLACVRPGSSPVPTVLARFDALGLGPAEIEVCEAAPFLVRNGRRSFYSTILAPSRPFVRFDSGCMAAINDAAIEITQTILACAGSLSLPSIEWAPGDILVIDNWQILHGRGRSAVAASTGRELLRVTVQ